MFFAAWKDGLSISELQYRARSMLFLILHKSILSPPVYGLEGLGEGELELETSLGRFEQALQSVNNGKRNL